MIADRPFSQRVLARVAEAERAQRKRESLRFLLPLAVITIIGTAWSVALLDGIVSLRLFVEGLAWVSAVGALEQRLSSALLGAFAPLPLIVSLLLFLAAIVWVRAHQPDPPEPLR